MGRKHIDADGSGVCFGAMVGVLPFRVWVQGLSGERLTLSERLHAMAYHFSGAVRRKSDSMLYSTLNIDTELQA